MKFEGGNPPGEFASKALVKDPYTRAWILTKDYYFSLEEAIEAWNPGKNPNATAVKWPVEMQDDSLVYVPAPEEMK